MFSQLECHDVAIFRIKTELAVLQDARDATSDELELCA